MQRGLNIPKVFGPRVPQTILIIVLCDFGLAFWRIGSVCLSLELQNILHIPKAPGPRVPQTILIIIFLDLVVWTIIWENWIWLLIIYNTQDIVYPK